MKKLKILILDRNTLVSLVLVLSGLLLSAAYLLFQAPSAPEGGEGSLCNDKNSFLSFYPENDQTQIEGMEINQESTGAGKLSEKFAKLAIIIDDFGSDRKGVEEMMTINRHITFAIMPFCPYSQLDAEKAKSYGHEVIIHLPMEPVRGKRSWLGPRGILSGMQPDEVRKIVSDSFDNVTFAVGADIHMGSKASSEEGIVGAVLDIIKERGLLFVDSRTAARPVSREIAGLKGVMCFDRDVFLDGQQSKSFIKKRLEEAAEIAEKKGYAIAIGHVGIEGGRVTAEAISEMIPEFDRRNIRLVFVSELNID